MIDDRKAYSSFLGSHNAPERNTSFWHHSVGLFRELLAIMGFEMKSKSTRKYKCDAPGYSSKIPITTLVFRKSNR